MNIDSSVQNHVYQPFVAIYQPIRQYDLRIEVKHFGHLCQNQWNAENNEEREYPFLFSFPRAPRVPRGLNGRSHAFVNKLLDAVSFVGLAGIDVDLRVDCDVATSVEVARQT